MENQEINEVTTQETEQKAVETIKITFSRKLAKPFTSKGGKEMVAISIPNQDAEDKRSWEEFVLPIQMLHSDHYGSKTLWAKIPEDGSTTLTRSIKPAEDGGSWTREERTVDNKTLKSMVEAYKLKPKTQGAR
ncbi:MAG: hypothetical protein IJK83_09945 [Clostridiales bacterium]|nr:hypothetical protein [Clostridiales bacterium]